MARTIESLHLAARLAAFVLLLVSSATWLATSASAFDTCKAVLATGCQEEEPEWYFDDEEKCEAGCPSGFPYPDEEFCSEFAYGCGGTEIKWTADCDCHSSPPGQ